MTLRATTALLFVALVGSGCALVSTASCDFANTDQIEALLGENDLETLSVEGLDECVFTSVDDPAQQIEIRIETVPDPQIFFEHAVEATDPSRVQTFDLDADDSGFSNAILFEDEAVLGRNENQIALITSTIPTEQLVDVLSTTLDLLTQTE